MNNASICFIPVLMESASPLGTVATMLSGYENVTEVALALPHSALS